MEKPIIINLAGGLGNQLFQFAAGIYIEETMGRNVKYNTSNLVKKTKSEVGNYTRPFELAQLIPNEKIIKKRVPARFNSLVFSLQKKLNPSGLLIENDLLDNVLERLNEKTKHLHGYFQNSEIVERVWPKMRQMLFQSEKFTSVIGSERYERIAIHLRFGDYSINPKTKSTHGLTKISYYTKAINHLMDLNANLNSVLIVTDDQYAARKFLSNVNKNLDFEVSSNTDPLVNLSEIAKSSNIIISNSSFSWWGAWFAFKEIGAKVIYPRPWLADLEDPNLPIYVNDWMQIKREFEI